MGLRKVGIIVTIAGCTSFEAGGAPVDAGVEAAAMPAPDAADAGDGQATESGAPIDAYASAVLADEPVGYWRMSLVQGVVANEIAGGPRLEAEASGTEATNDGPFTTENHAVRLSAAAMGGLHAADPAAYDFAGDHQYTLECWFRVDASANDAVLLSRSIDGDASATIDGYLIGVNHINQLIVVSGDATANANGGSVGAIPAGWHHGAMVADGTNLIGYLDGQAVVSKPRMGAPTSNPGVPFAVGFEPGRKRATHFTGAIDEVAVYDRALTKTQIANHVAAKN